MSSTDQEVGFGPETTSTETGPGETVEAVPETETAPGEPAVSEEDRLREQVAELEAQLAEARATSDPRPAVMAQYEEHMASSTEGVAGATNQAPVLPVSAQVSAAKAHAFFGHFIAIAQEAQRDIERVVPPGLLQAAETEAAKFARSLV